VSDLTNLVDTARKLDVHPQTLRRYALEGAVRSYKLPGEQGRLRFDLNEVREDLRARKNT
jgi:predicted site-specific integrase-resolvase